MVMSIGWNPHFDDLTHKTAVCRGGEETKKEKKGKERRKGKGRKRKK